MQKAGAASLSSHANALAGAYKYTPCVEESSYKLYERLRTGFPARSKLSLSSFVLLFLCMKTNLSVRHEVETHPWTEHPLPSVVLLCL